MTERHILDLRAGVPWSADALDVLARASRSAWGNPSHPSSEGRRAATWLEAAAATVRELTGFPHVAFFPDRTTALQAVVALYPGARVTASATHRRQVLPLVDLVAPVDSDGIPLWSDADVALVQGANEETGVIDSWPVAALRVLDASNSLGRTADTPDATHVIADAAAWGAPGGVAIVLGLSPLRVIEVPPLPLVALAVHRLAEHWQVRTQRAAAEAGAMQGFESRVLAAIPDVQFHGTTRVAHIRSFSILHLDAETLTRALDVEGFVVGSGSACVSDGTPSHVLAAMGRITHGNVRLALPVDLELTVLDEFADVLARTVRRLREEAGVTDL
jgi:cysteine desulfurase